MFELTSFSLYSFCGVPDDRVSKTIWRADMNRFVSHLFFFFSFCGKKTKWVHRWMRDVKSWWKREGDKRVEWGRLWGGKGSCSYKVYVSRYVGTLCRKSVLCYNVADPQSTEMKSTLNWAPMHIHEPNRKKNSDSVWCVLMLMFSFLPSLSHSPYLFLIFTTIPLNNPLISCFLLLLPGTQRKVTALSGML